MAQALQRFKMIINARFPSECPDCGQRIAFDERVEWVSGGKARHLSCAGVSAPTSTPTATPWRRRKSEQHDCATCGKRCNARYRICYACKHGLTPSTEQEDSSDTVRDLPALDDASAAALAAIRF